MIRQESFSLTARPRGFHIITREVITNLGDLPNQGILNLYIKHTSAGLTINEAADPDVLIDFESFFNKIVPENEPFLVHTIEGPDDMPAHIKASLVGSSITIPITDGKLDLGTWQGIYLCEFRNLGGSRKVVATIYH
jgi:secondary thiamine-phosphate synthase enzyme